MAQGLHLAQRMTQSQVLAPQMLQSLALLQAQTLELKALVEQELQQNPVLEEVPPAELEQQEKVTQEGNEQIDQVDPTEPPEDVNFDPATEKPNDEPVDDFQAEFEKLVQLDQEWRDNLSDTNFRVRSTADDEEKRQFMFDSLVANASLQEALLEQVRLSNIPEDQRPIADMLIGNIDDHGYLKATVEELAQTTSLPPEKILEVLKVVQSFDPPGVGARDLQECLLLQLERAGQTATLEYQIISKYMDALGKRRIPEIARGLGIEVDEVQEALERIACLEPRPGRVYLSDNNQYISPEIFVQKVGDEFVVTNNNEQIPHLRISNAYKDLMAAGNNAPEVRSYIREKIRAGKFLIKSLHQRQMTILNIAKQIVERQREFMEKGVAFLKPLTMQPVAEAVGVHETTVSRAVSGKYMQTPQGVFEMKYFFTGGIQTSDGVGVSNTTVKDMVAEMFRNENPAKPLSDQEIVKMLADKGIVMARRTVAKYRSELNILPSNLRKVY
ncbi:MAG: RNA polymerase factor sigma-54 [Verrucomicrobia bacterium]|nr:RNA polymerase factor sigma-54 [Verrucomicrobiota bacterium]